MESSTDLQMSNERALYLRVTSGSDAESIFPLTEGIIGSASSADIQLSDPQISKIHARITMRNGGWWITDLTTAPDLRVNNSIVKSRKIQFGDSVSIGNTSFQVVSSPAGMNQPERNESTTTLAAGKDAPLSQTMHITMENNIGDWKPGKPKPEPVSIKDKTEQIKASTKKIKTHTNPQLMQTYRTNTHPGNQTAGKGGSRVMVYFLLICALAASLLVGGVYLTEKKNQKRELAEGYRLAQDFEMNNPVKFTETIELYRRLHVLSAGINPSLAISAEDNIRRLEEAQNKLTKDFEDTLAELDKRAETLAEEGDFQRALDVYENYIGKFSDKVSEARKTEIISLKGLAGQSQSSDATQASSQQLNAKATAPPPPSPLASPRRNIDNQVNEVISSSVDYIIAGDIQSAEDELKKIASLTSDQKHDLTLKRSLLVIQQLRTVDDAVRKAATDASANVDPSEDQSQPAIVRLIYYLRKNDLFAAQVIAGKVDDSLIAAELKSRARLSPDQMAIEKEVIAEFAKIWVAMAASPSGKIPRPTECIDMLSKENAGKSANTATGCRAMIKLAESNSTSHFISRYKEFFEACRTLSTQLTEKAAKHQRAGNAVIIDVDGNTCFFEASEALPDPASGKAGLMLEKRVFYQPGTVTPAGAIIEITTVLPYRKMSDLQGVFDIPNVFTSKKPEKGDRILVSTDISPGCMVIPLHAENKINSIYASDFTNPHGREWAAKEGRLETIEGSLIMDMTRARNRCSAGKPDFEFRQKLGSSPLDISFTASLMKNSDLVVILNGVQFALTDRPGRKSGIFCNGHRTSYFKHPAVKYESPVRVDVHWTPDYSILKIAEQSYLAPVDKRYPSESLNSIGFAVTGQVSLDDFSVSKSDLNSDNKIVGVSGNKSEVLIKKLPKQSWQDLQAGHVIFIRSLADRKSKKKKTEDYTLIKSPITSVYDEYVVSRIANPSEFTGLKATASLSERGIQSNSREEAVHLMPGEGWIPPAFLGHINTNNQHRLIVPDISSSFGAQGYLATVSSLVVHPYTKEPYAAFTSSAKLAAFTENSGLLQCETVEAISAKSDNKCVILTGFDPAGKNMISLTPPAFTMNPTLFPQPSGGWKAISGEWSRKLNRLLSPPTSAKPAVIESHHILWENCQYSIDLRIESGSVSTNKSEIIIELFSPLWQRAVSLETGSKGTSIGADLISSALGHHGPKSNLPDSKSGIVLKKEQGFRERLPALSPGKFYNIIIRRAGDTFAFYLDGKRFATLLHSGMRGDLVLRVASVSGQTSFGPSSASLISRSCKIPTIEPDLGEFGYILAVEGAGVMFDSDPFNFSRGDTISIMKPEKIIAGEKSKTVVLKKVALGKITDANHRSCVAVTSSLVEPILAGMKVMPGQQPETLTLTSGLMSGDN